MASVAGINQQKELATTAGVTATQSTDGQMI